VPKRKEKKNNAISYDFAGKLLRISASWFGKKCHLDDESKMPLKSESQQE
jgi:hypothetical protein